MSTKYFKHVLIILVISIFLISIAAVNNASAQDRDTNQPPYLSNNSLTRSVQENLPIESTVGNPLQGVDPEGLTVNYSITYGIGSYAYFIIDYTTGQLSTKQVLDYENKSSHTIRVNVVDPGGNSSRFKVTINVINDTSDDNSTNNPPEFIEGDSTTRNIVVGDPNSLYLGSPILATDPDGGTLYYAVTFEPSGILYMGNPGHDDTVQWRREIPQLKHQLHPEFRGIGDTYTAELTVWDDHHATDTIQITINVVGSNSPPTFLEGTSATRSIEENTGASIDIGKPIYAIDAEERTIAYSLGGSDAFSFSINSETGQLQTAAPLDYETKNTYTVTVTASDGKGGSNSITITIDVTDVNESPLFSEGTSTTRSIAENTPSNRNIGSPVSATDPDGNTLTYILSGTDATSFSIVKTSGQLRTAAPLDYETKNAYTVIVNVSDGKGGSDSITVTINVTNVNEPVTPPPVQQDNSQPPPQTDPQPPVQRNNPPVFSDGTSTTRSVAENTPSNRNIGNAVTATDPDGETLIYSLSGVDAAAFSIDSNTGQLQTVAALDYESKNVYSVTITATDQRGLKTSIDVTINVTDINETVVPPSVQQSQPQSQPDSEPQPDAEPESEPEPNYTILPFNYEKEGVGKVVITEVMLAHLNKYPQWIELYNTTNQDIDVKGWRIVGRCLDDKTMNILDSQVISKSLTIKSKEAALIVGYAVPNSRVGISKGLADKTDDLGWNNKNYWDHDCIVLELQDTEGNPIDRIGNLNEKNEIVWEIPEIVRDKRISLMRRLKPIRSQEYNFTFGMKAFGWFPANKSERLTSGRSEYYYGRYTDIGSPGYRAEEIGLLPVTLSAFNPTLNQDGSVVIRWVTESEVDNAGFNILRSEKPQGPFIKVNPKLVQGAGTTGERNEYVWTDNTAKPNVEYYYQIEDVSYAGVHQTLATRRVKGIFTAKHRQITSWGKLKRDLNLK